MKLSELVQIDSPRPGCGGAACESCGGEFACGAKLSGCWCSEVRLDDETRAELRARFRGCLCRTCLEAYAARGAEGGARDGGG
jgi:hypothetical protein